MHADFREQTGGTIGLISIHDEILKLVWYLYMEWWKVDIHTCWHEGGILKVKNEGKYNINPAKSIFPPQLARESNNPGRFHSVESRSDCLLFVCCCVATEAWDAACGFPAGDGNLMRERHTGSKQGPCQFHWTTGSCNSAVLLTSRGQCSSVESSGRWGCLRVS